VSITILKVQHETNSDAGGVCFGVMYYSIVNTQMFHVKLQTAAVRCFWLKRSKIRWITHHLI